MAPEILNQSFSHLTLVHTLIVPNVLLLCRDKNVTLGLNLDNSFISIINTKAIEAVAVGKF